MLGIKAATSAARPGKADVFVACTDTNKNREWREGNDNNTTGRAERVSTEG
jgi:hypothetical protein